MNNPPETSTPRCDAEAIDCFGRDDFGHEYRAVTRWAVDGEFVGADFARSLETELAAANAKLAEWRGVAKELVLVVENANCSCSLLRGDCSRCAALTRFHTLNTTEK